MKLNPMPAVIKLDLDEIRAVEKALDSLPCGSADIRAKEVEAQAIADHRKAMAEKNRLEAGHSD